MAALPPTVAAGAQRSQYDLAFQICPILLSGGIVSSSQGGLLPVVQIWGGSLTDKDPFCRFVPLPGGKLISQTVAQYPFANQFVAGNATIAQPLNISLAMIAPVNQSGGYLKKLHIFSSIKTALENHNALGGTYIIATPSFIYQNCLMLDMSDISPEDADKQQQIEWQLDFTQPLVTQAGAAAAQSSTMAKISSGGQLPIGTLGWSGTQVASPATLTGVTGALQAFGATAQPPGLASSGGALSGNPSGGNVA